MSNKRTRGKGAKISEGEKHIKEADHTLSEAAPCIKPKFKDDKYLVSRKIEDYHYSIYVKPAKPEVRDAIVFLNIAIQRREYLLNELSDKAQVREYMRIATNRLIEYVDKNIGELKLFFTKSRNFYPLTGIIMEQHMWRQDFPLELLLDLIQEYDDKSLYILLLMHLHTKKTINVEFIRKILENRDFLLLYLDGASYEKSVKKDLIKLYDNTRLGNPKKPELKTKLCKFILDYYKKYEEVYSYVESFIQKKVENIKKEICKTGELSKVTDNFLFRRMIMRGEKEKSVCIEFLPFCRENVEYFANKVCLTICVGNGALSMPGSLSDTERIGEKLKLLSNNQLYRIMRSIFDEPTNLAKLSSEFGVTPNTAYRILAKLVEERYILKKDNHAYVANKKHFRNIINLIERFGGEE